MGQARAVELLYGFQIYARLFILVRLLKVQLIFLKRVEEDGRVMNIAHRILVIVHVIQIFRGMFRQEGLDRLDHVAELLKGDPHLVDCVWVPGIEPAKAC